MGGISHRPASVTSHSNVNFSFSLPKYSVSKRTDVHLPLPLPIVFLHQVDWHRAWEYCAWKSSFLSWTAGSNFTCMWLPASSPSVPHWRRNQSQQQPNPFKCFCFDSFTRVYVHANILVFLPRPRSCSLVEGLNQSASGAPGSTQSCKDPASFHSYCFPNNCLLVNHLSPQRLYLKLSCLIPITAISHNPALPRFISLLALTSLGMISLSFQASSVRFLPKSGESSLTDASSEAHLVVIPSRSPSNEWTHSQHRSLFNSLNNLLFKSPTLVLHPTRFKCR